MLDNKAAQAEFERAWNDARYSRAVLPPVDVNGVLARWYETDGEPLVFTADMLWDMEVRKAGDPAAFIPYVVQEGTATAWVPGREDGAVGLGDAFVRRSAQRLWLRPDEYGLVLEEVYLDHEEKVVTFLGRAEFPEAPEGRLSAGTGQPLFHVQHGVAGTAARPTNTWRIVVLTDEPDERVVKVFEEMAAEVWLPGFVENYARDVLGVPLTRKG
ncbi:hypothetical protein ACFY7H_15250 [Streptomyces sp. NPDC012794]|uniref:hypothetical protein n=1 Tax=Streptomyces sp. NPDC012794 TaxID=3364850 RepID=UPI00367E50D4